MIWRLLSSNATKMPGSRWFSRAVDQALERKDRLAGARCAENQRRPSVGSPPPVISSKPAMPVGLFAIAPSWLGSVLFGRALAGSHRSGSAYGSIPEGSYWIVGSLSSIGRRRAEKNGFATMFSPRIGSGASVVQHGAHLHARMASDTAPKIPRLELLADVRRRLEGVCSEWPTELFERVTSALPGSSTSTIAP